MNEAEIIARVEADRQEQRLARLLKALTVLASDAGDDREPADSISREDAAACYNRQEAWFDGHAAGILTGKWLAATEVQDLLDDWERDV